VTNYDRTPDDSEDGNDWGWGYHHGPGWLHEEPYQEEALDSAPDDPYLQDSLSEEDRYAARYGRDRRDRESVERVFDRVVYALVPVKSRFEAVAKAAVAFEYSSLVEDVPAAYDVDDHGPLVELVSTFDKDSRRTLAGELGDLPEAVPVVSEEGQRLFADARARTIWEGGNVQHDGPTNKQDSRTLTSGKPVLIDEFGAILDHWSQLLDRLEGTPVPETETPETTGEHTAAEITSEFGSTEPTLWIVPGFAFRAEKVSPQPVADPVGNNRELLACDICKTETVHKIAAVERLEEESETSDHPAGELAEDYVDEHIWELEIWECTRCGAPRS
jgi:hypothetical protein